MKLERSFWIAICVLFAIALVGTGMVLYRTRYGTRVGSDAVRYVMTATNLDQGHGYTRTSGAGEYVPETGFPPIFSVVLAVLRGEDSDLYLTARWLNAILFGVNIFLVGFLIFRNTASIWPAALSALLVGFMRYQNVIHASVMSEALFISFMLITLLCLCWYLDTYRYPLLVITGLLVSVATLTRFVGFALMAMGVLGILLLASTSWKRRVLDSAVFGVLSFTPVLLWFGRNASSGGSMTNRVWAFHPMRPEVLQGYLTEISTWVVPPVYFFAYRIRLILLAAIGLLGPGVYVIRNLKAEILNPHDDRKPFYALPWLLILYLISYLGILIINSTFLDAATTASAPPRYLSPLYMALVILIVTTLYWNIGNLKKGKYIGVFALFLAGILLLLKTQANMDFILDPEPNLGYHQLRISHPKVVETLEGIDISRHLMTNNPEIIYALIERPATMWPIYYDAYRDVYNESFEQNVASANKIMRAGGVLVVFGHPEADEMSVLDLLEVEPFTLFDVATFYGHPEEIPK